MANRTKVCAKCGAVQRRFLRLIEEGGSYRCSDPQGCERRAETPRGLGWAYCQATNAWYHGSSDFRIDPRTNGALLSVSRRTSNGYVWVPTALCDSLEQAKTFGTALFRGESIEAKP